MYVADRNCQGVSYIRWFWWFGQVQQACNHELDLRLFGSSVAHDCRFDRQRRVGYNRQACLGSSQHGYASHVSKLERRLYIDGVKHVLYADNLGSVGSDDLGQPMADLH